MNSSFKLNSNNKSFSESNLNSFLKEKEKHKQSEEEQEEEELNDENDFNSQWAPPSPIRSRSNSPLTNNNSIMEQNKLEEESNLGRKRKKKKKINELNKLKLLSNSNSSSDIITTTGITNTTNDLQEYLAKSKLNQDELLQINETEERRGISKISSIHEKLPSSTSIDDCSIHSAPELDLNNYHHHLNSNSPLSPTSSASSPTTTYEDETVPFSLWDYLQEEVLAVETSEEQDGQGEGRKSERVTNFLTVPGEVEKIIMFGFVICLDSFLYTFTILPLRICTSLLYLLFNTFHNFRVSIATFTFSTPKLALRYKRMRLSHKCDLTKALMLITSLVILNRTTDASKMYHSVRGQETIKLYVIFNVLEIADRLCCSFGQDLQDSLFSRETLGRRTDGSHPHLRPIALFALNVGYIVAHTLVLFYQLVTLNVAINSYNNALLTLLLSNQFVEIKGSVFKKFEKENLFQLTCADIVERFQLALMLFIIALRNLIEVSSSSTSTTSSLLSFLPASFPSLSSLPTLSLLQTIFSPAIVVLLSECVVDWLKHAFITKFNHIRPAVYKRFIDVLCIDLVASTRPGKGKATGKNVDQPFVDQSPLVSRRLGFASLPLGCLVVRVIFQAFQMLADESHLDECAPLPSTLPHLSNSNLYMVLLHFWNGFTELLFGSGWGSGGGILELVKRAGGWLVLGLVAIIGWACLIALKLLIGINLRAFAAHRHSTMELRVPEDDLNGTGRPRIGVTASEKILAESSSWLDDGAFDVVGKKKGKIGLSELSRYDLIKSRLW